METIDKIWNADGLTDSKHILNTSNQIVEQSILDEIEQKGVTLERLNEFNKSGLHIYMYYTQITIHGLFPELCSHYLSGYKTLFQNKNLSIGVKWQGIDNEKKRYIYSLCQFAGWHISHSSSEWDIFKQKRCANKEEAIEKAVEYKKELSNLDTTLFYGYADVSVKRDVWGCIWAVAEVSINGIPAANVNKVIEQITSKSINELEQMKSEKEAERAAEQAERERQYAANKIIEDAKRAELLKEKEAFIQANELTNFVKVENNPIANGQIYASVRVGANGLYWAFVGIKKIGANLCKFDCDINGVKINKAVQCYSTKISGYLKSEVKQVATIAPSKQSAKLDKLIGVKLVNYSDKAIAVIGDTKPIKEALKSLGGRFNMHLNCGAGWIFSKAMESKLNQLINNN